MPKKPGILPHTKQEYDALSLYMQKRLLGFDSSKGYMKFSLPPELQPEWTPKGRKKVECAEYEVEPIGYKILPNDYVPCMWRIDLVSSKGNFSALTDFAKPAPSLLVKERFEKQQRARNRFQEASVSEEEAAFQCMEDVLYAETPGGLGTKISLPEVRYISDIETWAKSSDQALTGSGIEMPDDSALSSRGITSPFSSVFEPLIQDNALHESATFVAGIHRPYLYESGDAPGAMFALHKEDHGLDSANYCIFGKKMWLLISPISAGRLEESVGRFIRACGFSEIVNRKNGKSAEPWTGNKQDSARVRPGNVRKPEERCDQWVRHQMVYVSLAFLRHNDIEFEIVTQKAGDVIFTKGDTYHQGFCLGRTLNEAINLAPKDWDADMYTQRQCSSICPVNKPITIEMLKKRVPQSDMQDLPTDLKTIYGGQNPWKGTVEGDGIQATY